jgi:hypothetical protein
MQNKISKAKTKLKNALSFARLKTKQTLRHLTQKDFIHVFGDSHSLVFQHEIFQIHYIGPATAHNLHSEQSATKSKQQIENTLNNLPKTKKAYALFVFGEIDARIHIYNTHKKKNIPTDDAIHTTLTNYVSYLETLKKTYPHITLMAFNVIPQGEQGNYYNYPFYADRKTRQEITVKMNTKLKELAKEKNIIFIETFDILLEPSGERKKEYIFDEIHFNNGIIPYITEEIKRKVPDFRT